jgi:hypothetical protein
VDDKQMPDDSFICPVCGAEVPAKAKACPECGSDEKTGWSDSTIYDGTGIEDPEDFDYDEYIEREIGKRRNRDWVWVVALVMLILFVWLLVHWFG